MDEENSGINEQDSDMDEENSDINEEDSDMDEENSDINEEDSDMDEENSDIDEEDSDIDEENSGRIARRTKALRDFAVFLRSKTQDGIAGPLSFAIERDGERLFHLASCCLNFVSAVNGEGLGSL